MIPSRRHGTRSISTPMRQSRLTSKSIMNGSLDLKGHSMLEISYLFHVWFWLTRSPRYRMMQGHLARLGKQVGINFGFGGKTGNTRDSHRLIQLAKTKGDGMQTKVVEQLFNSYFEVNEDITDREVLIARAVKAGLDETETREWMDNGKGGPEVDKEVIEAQEKFISGVPNFT